MTDPSFRESISRRGFLARSAAGAAGAWGAHLLPLSARAAGRAPGQLPKVAAIITEFTYRSHAHVILENFLESYFFNGQVTDPGFDVSGFYIDQFPENDMGRSVAAEYRVTMYDTIEEALKLGGKELAVDAVLSIGEHGKYPHNEKGQHMYPRKRFFDEIVAVFRESGRSVPVFTDKHLSYRWDWAKEMVDTARELDFPLMAGSSVPLATRRPAMEIPDGAVLTEAISIHGGGVESYDFHALEVLQSQIESRRGGETGVRAVQFVDGEAVWKAADEGRWSIPLAEAAMRAELGDEALPLAQQVEKFKGDKNALHAILIEHVDGLASTILKIGDSSTRWNFACRIADKPEPLATSYYVGPWQNRNLFKALSHAIQTHFRDGKSPYPLERTLLVTGILDVEMESRFQGGKRLETPQLAWGYKTQDFRAMREMGATWHVITEDKEEPLGIHTAFEFF